MSFLDVWKIVNSYIEENKPLLPGGDRVISNNKQHDKC